MGSIAALSLLLVLPSFMVVPAPIQASAREMDMIADQQNDQAGSSQLGALEEPIGGVEGITDGNAGEDVEAPAGESEGVKPEENVGEQDDTQAVKDSDADLLADSVTQTVYNLKPLYNNGFEMPVNADGTIPGWSMFFAPNDGTSHEISHDVRYYGNSSLKLVDKSNTLPIYLQSDERSVTPGYTYNGSAMMYIAPNAGNAAGASLVLRFYDATGTQVNTDKDGENIVHLRQVGVWTRVTVTGTAPANAVYARVAASISNYFTAESGAFYDDFTLTSPQEEKAAGTLHLQMPSGILMSQTLEAKILLSRGIDVQSVFGSLAYDPTTLEVADVAVASDFNAGGLATVVRSNEEPGILKFEVSKAEGSVSNDQQVLIVKFKVKGNAEKVDVTLQEGSGVQDIDGVYISPEAESASTYIRRASLDVNGDGKLDIYDVMAVAKLVGQMATNDNWKYDVNNDGRIDQADVEMLTDAILTKLLDENEGGRSL
jgi:hypothetical protein